VPLLTLPLDVLVLVVDVVVVALLVVCGVATPLDATPVAEYTTSVEGTASVEFTVTKVCPSAGGGTRF
jgi:hypothetical protein